MDWVADEVAQNYLSRVKFKEGFIAAACPFHKDGQERKPSFWINRENGAWGCFTCEMRGGNLRDLLKKIGVSSYKLEAELKRLEKEEAKSKKLKEVRKKKKNRADFKGNSILPEALLGVYDWCPVSLVEDGFTEETLREHDIGYDKARERVTYPIRDVYGNLIGISGRAHDGEHPKYKVYTGRKYNDEGKLITFGELGEDFPGYSSDNIRDHLWRGQHVYNKLYTGEDDQLIIVEGYKAAMWLVQHGWINTVAIMGARMSKAQERLISRMGTSTWVFLDNNDAGLSGARDICKRLAMGTFPVYRCYYPIDCDESVQPDDLTEDEIEIVLTNAKRVGGSHATRFSQSNQRTKKGKR